MADILADNQTEAVLTLLDRGEAAGEIAEHIIDALKKVP